MSASVRLREWREEKNLSLVEAGKLIGVSSVAIWEWENARKQPRIIHALAIERITDGAVPVHAWAPESTTKVTEPKAV